jgi:hypothetical protein
VRTRIVRLSHGRTTARRSVALYELCAGLLGIHTTFLAGVTPDGRVLSFNVYLLILCITSVCLGALLWKPHSGACLRSGICQAIQLPRVFLSTFSFAVLCGIDVEFRVHGPFLSLVTMTGVQIVLGRSQVWPNPGIGLNVVAAMLVALLIGAIPLGNRTRPLSRTGVHESIG